MWIEPSGVTHEDVLWMWQTMAAVAFILAVLANGVPRRPLRTWVGDLLVRWGIAGLLVWFFTAGMWGIREFVNLKVGIPMGPLEAVIEHMTVYGALATGMLTVWVMGVALLAHGLFARPVKAPARAPTAPAMPVTAAMKAPAAMAPMPPPPPHITSQYRRKEATAAVAQ